MKGQRRDAPTRGAKVVDYTPPSPGWDYWEREFEKAFPEDLRKNLLRRRTFFHLEKEQYHSDKRMGLRELKAEIRRFAKGNSDQPKKTETYIRASASDFIALHPECTDAEICQYLLGEMAIAPEDFVMPFRPQPEGEFLPFLLQTLSEAGFNCSRGSNEIRRSIKGGDDQAPSSAFLDFCGAMIWGLEPNSITKSKIQLIQTTLRRMQKFK